MLGRINESGKRAAAIVQNMLSFTRNSDTAFSTHNMGELLDKCIELAGSDYDFKKHYDFRQIEIIRNYDELLPEVVCDSGKIQQVLLNLLRNGAEAMQDYADSIPTEVNRPKPTFTLSVTCEDDMICVDVEDNGPGMDEATRKRVFEPFFSTKATDKGTGLGLSVSYFMIKENHGGELLVDSTPGKGTRFTIKLPVGTSVTLPIHEVEKSGNPLL